MDLTSPLRSLIPSLDSAVLEVLARTESGLSASRVSRLATRGSRQGLSLALDRLVEHGLVIAEPANQGFLYRLNRDHVLTGALLLALDARHMVLEQLKGAVEQLEPRPLHVSVFGSFARADGTASSDIDLFVVCEAGQDLHDEVWQQQLHEMEDRVLRWTGNRMEPLVLTPETLATAIRAREPIVNSVLEESICLLGAQFSELVTDVPSKGRPRGRS